MSPPSSNPAPGHGGFATTRWSLIVAAQASGTGEAHQALADLCRLYWYPIYAYVRRRGHSHADAEDLTQEFFARLLDRDGLAGVRASRGRFRAFLLAACQNFLANEWDRARALKRGGGRTPLPLDLAAADGRYRQEPGHDETAERLFARRWALALLQQVLNRLRAEYAASGKTRLFEALKNTLSGESIGESNGRGYAALGAELGMSEGAVKVAVHRLRRRYRELLRDEIAQTVDSPEQIDEEIRTLFAALAG